MRYFGFGLDDDEDDETKSPGKKRRSTDWLDYVKVLIMPVVVGGASFYLGQKQIESAETTARAQAKAEEERASATLNLQRLRAEDDKELAKLGQIKAIFTSIVAADKVEFMNEAAEAALLSEIASLAVYKHTSLPFLLRIEDHFCAVRTNREKATKSGAQSVNEMTQNRSFPRVSDTVYKNAPGLRPVDDECDQTGTRSKPEQEARRTIQRIIYNSQLDLRNEEFRDQPLRFAQLSDYDLSEARFINTNLYMADMQRSTLKGACFENTDLVRTDFSHANLKNVRFVGAKTQLFETNFTEAMLDGVTFDKNISCLEKAIFKLFTLLQVQTGGVFHELDDTIYTVLLANNLKRIRGETSDGKDAEKKMQILLSDFEEDQRFPQVVKKVVDAKMCDRHHIRTNGGTVSDDNKEAFYACLDVVSASLGKRCLNREREREQKQTQNCPIAAQDVSEMNGSPGFYSSAARH